MVRIFLHSDWIRTRVTPNTDVFYAMYVLPLFTKFSAVDAMLPIMVKVNVILKSECRKAWEFPYSWGEELNWVKSFSTKEHLLLCNHWPDFEDFSVLDTNNNDIKVTLMESLLINRDHPLLNKNKWSVYLELFDN